MANPIAYNSGTTVSGCINTGTISLAIDNLNYSTRPGNLNWYAGADPTNRYLIVSDTYSQGVDTQANSKPTIWATSALTDNELLKWINGLPARSGQSTFGTLADAVSWLTGQNKYLISNQHYPQIVTSGMVLNLDAGFTSSYPNVGTNWYDLYSGGTGSLNNGPTWNNLGMSSNISFDGTNDYYELTNRDTSLEFQPNQSYSCFIIFKSPASMTSNGNALIANMINSGTFSGWDIWFNDTGQPNMITMHLISSWFTNAIKVAVDYDFSTLANKWVCFGYTYDGTCPTTTANTLNSVDFYFNGNLYTTGKRLGQTQSSNPGQGTGFTSSATTITYNANQRFRVASRWLLGSWSSGLRTSVAKVLVYNRKLTASEFAQNFYLGPIVTSGLTFAIDAGNLVSYGGVGTTVYDLTTTGVTGTLTNGPTWTYLSGGTFSFDGVDDYIDCNNKIVNLNSSFSFVVWVRTPSNLSDNNNYRRLLGRGDTYSSYTGEWAALSYDFQGDSFTIAIDDDVTKSEYLGNIILTPNTWYCATMVVDRGNKLYLYVNDILDGSVDDNTSLNVDPPYNLYVGAMRTNNVLGYPIKGNISTAQVYNRALSESEIKQNFEAYRGRFGV